MAPAPKRNQAASDPAAAFIRKYRSGREYAAERAARFEDAVVEQICKLTNQLPLYRQLRSAKKHRATNAPRYVNLVEFQQLCVFPVYLFAELEAGQEKFLRLPALFERFERSDIYKRYVDLADAAPEDAAGHALVYFFPHLKHLSTKQGGALVLHNYNTGGAPSPLTNDITTVLVRIGLQSGESLWLETLPSFISRFNVVSTN